jgi:hypothetical protein
MKQVFIYPATAHRMLRYLRSNPGDTFGTLDMFPTWPSESAAFMGGGAFSISRDLIWHPDLGI